MRLRWEATIDNGVFMTSKYGKSTESENFTSVFKWPTISHE